MNNYKRALEEFNFFAILKPDEIDNIIDIADSYYKIGDFENSYVCQYRGIANKRIG